MTSGIYKLTNKSNGKIYIGSAVNIKKRWGLHERHAFQDKPKFLISRALKKHGINGFSWEIIEEVKKKELLLEREQHYLDTFKPFAPKGYNVCKTAGNTLGVKWSKEQRKKILRSRKKLGNFGKWNIGKPAPNREIPHSEETKRKISEVNKGKFLGRKSTRAKTTVFRSPEGELVEFESINQGSKERGLHVACMAEVARGVRRHYKGWTCPNAPIYKPVPRCNHVVISPSGEEYTITNIKKFSKEHELSRDALAKVLTKSQKQHKGWRKPGTKIKQYEIHDSDGKSYMSFELKQFCLEHDLNYSSMRAVACGNQKQHKGWTVTISLNNKD